MLHSRRFHVSFLNVCLLVSFFLKHLNSISTLWRNKSICLSCFFFFKLNFDMWIFSNVNTSCYVNDVMFSSHYVNATRITSCFKGCFLNLVPTFPLVNQWKMMSTITKNIQNWESFEGKFEKFVPFEENICHLSFNSRKGTKRRREISKIHEKITVFRRKM